MAVETHMQSLNPLCFSTVACPEWDIDRVISAAKEWGYQGVELRTLGAGTSQLASDPALTDPDKVRHAFECAGIRISCLATSVALHYKSRREASQALDGAKSFIDLAARLGCERIRTFGYQIYPGETRFEAVRRIADRYAALAEYAESVTGGPVEIVIENAGSFARAKELWNLTNFTQHPLVGVCWNVAYAASVGEGPGTSVTCLNHRIRYAKLKDAAVGEGSGFTQLGEGTVEIERFIEILRGIGYEGWLCVEWDKLWLPGLEPAESILPRAREILTQWMTVALDKKGNPLSKREAAVAKK